MESSARRAGTTGSSSCRWRWLLYLLLWRTPVRPHLRFFCRVHRSNRWASVIYKYNLNRYDLSWITCKSKPMLILCSHSWDMLPTDHLHTSYVSMPSLFTHNAAECCDSTYGGPPIYTGPLRLRSRSQYYYFTNAFWHELIEGFSIGSMSFSSSSSYRLPSRTHWLSCFTATLCDPSGCIIRPNGALKTNGNAPKRSPTFPLER